MSENFEKNKLYIKEKESENIASVSKSTSLAYEDNRDQIQEVSITENIKIEQKEEEKAPIIAQAKEELKEEEKKKLNIVCGIRKAEKTKGTKNKKPEPSLPFRNKIAELEKRFSQVENGALASSNERLFDLNLSIKCYEKSLLYLFAHEEKNSFSEIPNQILKTSNIQSSYNKYVQTSILDKYLKNNLKFSTLGKNVIGVTVDDKLQLAVKVIEIERKPTEKLKDFNKKKKTKKSRILQEYYIGKTFGNYSNHAIKIFDIEIKETKDKNGMRAEILIENGGRDLSQIASELSESDLKEIASQLMDILETMEKIGIAHFDIKPENLVWNTTSRILKIIDFGVSVAFYQSPESLMEQIREDKNKMSGYTKSYAPPEMLLEKNYEEIIPHYADVFCFGLTILHLIFLRHRYKNWICSDKSEEGLQKYCKKIQDKLSELNESRWFKLIEPCLQFNPLKRLKSSDLKKIFIENIDVNIAKSDKEVNKGNFIDLAIKSLSKEELDVSKWQADASLITAEKQGNETNIILAQINLAYIYSRFGSHKLSKKLLDKVIEKVKIDNKFFNARETAIIYNEIGITYFYLCMYEESIKYYNKSIDILSTKPENILQLYDVYNNKASSLFCICKYDEAKNIFLECLNMHKKSSNNEIDIAIAYYNISNVYFRLGKFEESRQYLLDALNELGAENKKKFPCISLLYSNLGWISLLLGEFKRAKDATHTALNKAKEIYGDDRLDLVPVYCTITELYNCVGSFEKSVSSLIKEINIFIKLFGQNHPNMFAAYFYFGLTCIMTDEKKKAESYMKKCVELIEKFNLKDHILYAKSCIYLGVACLKLTKFDEAFKYTNFALDTLYKIYKDGHCDIGTAYCLRGYIYREMGDIDQAIKSFNDSMNFFNKSFNKENFQYIDIYNGIADCYSRKNSCNEALFYYVKSLKLCQSTYRKFNLHRADTYCGIADVLAKQGLFKKANKYYEKCLNEWSHILNGQHPRFVIVLEKSAAFFEKIGDATKSYECMEKAKILKR